MKLQSRASDKMEVLYPGNLALLSMFLKNPEDKENINKGLGKKGEPGPDCEDVLTCGSCRKDFLLADILRFIQHKVICLSTSALQRPKEEPSGDQNGDARASSPNEASSHHDHNANEDIDDSKDDKRKRESDEDTPVRKKSRSTQDAEANTVDTEYICGTCGSIIVSAWSLVQHVQSTHGICIYREAGQAVTVTSQTPSTPPGAPQPSHSSPLASVSSTGTTMSGASGPIPLLDPTKVDLSKVDLTKVDLSKIFPHIPGSTQLPPHPSAPLLDPTHPFNLLRMPLGDGRTPFPPGLAPPLVRPGHDFRMHQLLQEGLRLNPGLIPPPFGERPPFLGAGLGAPRHSTPTSLNSGSDQNLELYSQRLRQLAGTTSPTSSTSPRKSVHFSPPPQVPTPSSLNLSQTPTSTRSEDTQIVKPFGCSSCSKSFRWESNLIIHQRIHTGEKDFKCSKCDEVICTPQSLRLHMKSHKIQSGESNSPDSSKPQTSDDIDDEEDIEEEEEMEGDEEEEDDQEVEEDEDIEEEEIIDTTDDDEPEIEKLDEDQDDDAPEDLSTPKSTPTSTPQNVTSSTVDINRNRQINDPKSVVGELMNKFGLANLSAYSEAYHQAMKLSSQIPNLGKGENLYSNGMAKTIKLREDLAKGSMLPSLDIAHQTLLGSFNNPFEAQKRLAASGQDSSLYAGLWLPSLGAPRANPRDLFPGLPQSEANFLAKQMQMEGSLKSNDVPTSLPKPGSSSVPGTQLSPLSIKRDSRRNDTCEYCGKVFKNCSNLTVHRRSHTGEKPYKCDLCSYACTQSSKLNRHMKTHGRLGKDVYQCRFCEMPFSVASTLEKHMRKCVVNQNKKGLFSPLSTANHELGYKAMHFTQILSDESSKASSIFAPHFNPNAVPTNISNHDTGTSSNLSGSGS